MGRSSVSYTSRDYESLRQELLARAPQLTARWTDFNPSDLGVVLLEMLCAIGDMLSYYLDAQAGETFLATARRRESIINLCRLIGYRLNGPAAASTVLQFSLRVPLETALIIPAGTVCRAQLEEGESIDFETIEEAVVQPGQSSVQAGALQGSRRTQSFTGTGAPLACFALEGRQIAQGTVQVCVADEAWQEAQHFQDSDAQSCHYLCETDHLGTVLVTFGDGAAGRIPPAGAAIEVTWLETLGEQGNLGAALVRTLVSSIYLNGAAVALEVTNVSPANGGAASESNDHARAQAPAQLTTLWRTVTRTDFETLVTGLPGVTKARVIDPQDCPHLPYLRVLLAVAPQGGGVLTGPLKDAVRTFIEQRRVATVDVELLDPVYCPIDVEAQVFVLPGQELLAVERRIGQALADFLHFDRVDFGQDVHTSDLVAVIDAVPGVSHLTLLAPTASVTIKSGQIPALGHVYLDLRRTA